MAQAQAQARAGEGGEIGGGRLALGSGGNGNQGDLVTKKCSQLHTIAELRRVEALRPPEVPDTPGSPRVVVASCIKLAEGFLHPILMTKKRSGSLKRIAFLNLWKWNSGV